MTRANRWAWYCTCDPCDFDGLECRRCHRRPLELVKASVARLAKAWR